MTHIITQFDKDEFLKRYWQKKPCVIKRFKPDFLDPIDEHDLAGLAQESEVDSRIVSKINNKWAATQGPFDSFEKVCVGNWTLLVQGVDRYIDEVSELSELVNFIPSWRFDDVMVSYSIAGAGVGAHTDQYDVFILQGKGSRRWQVGLPDENAKPFSPHPLLKLIEDFDPIVDYQLETGDAIYIPPKYPHKGETTRDCINYSLGFRAPTNLEVLQGIFDYGESIEQAQSRYTDANLNTLRRDNKRDKKQTHNPAVVTKNELARLKQGMFELLSSNQADQALMSFLSRQALPEVDSEQALTFAEVSEVFENKVAIYKSPGVKPIFSENAIHSSVDPNIDLPDSPTHEHSVFEFFIDGQMFEVCSDLSDATIDLISQPSITGFPENLPLTYKTHYLNLITELVNAGYWYIDSQ